MSGFCCPVCGEALTSTPKTLVCANRHSFDVAKSGYVSLLQTSSRGNHGDNPQMVAARRAFLETGAYAHLRDAIGDLAERYATDGGTLLDSGCGEGYYTAAVLERLGARMEILGLDISKSAVRLAAKRCKQGHFAVASAFHIPVKDGSIDLLLQIFSPDSASEFARVLRRGGVLLECIPGRRHLYGLKAAVYDTPYENEVSPFEKSGYRFLEQRHLVREITLETPEDIRNLFWMTPYYYKTGAREQKRLEERTALTTETEFYVTVYQKL